MKEIAKEKKEKKLLAVQQAGKNEPLVGTPTSNSQITFNSGLANSSASEQSMSETDETKPKRIPVSELFCRQVPNIMILLVSYLFVATCSLLRGGHGVDSLINLQSCSDYSWAILGFSQVGLLLMIFFGSKSNKKPLGYHPTLEPIIKVKTAKIKLPANIKIIIVSFISGILAGTLGVGGGLVINPLLMGMGFDPITSTAMSNTSVFFSASSTTTQFLAAGAIHYEHAWLFTSLSLTGAFCGNFILAKLVKKYQKPSFIIWVVLAVLLISGIVMPTDLALTTDYSSWKKIFNFGPLC